MRLGLQLVSPRIPLHFRCGGCDSSAWWRDGLTNVDVSFNLYS